MSSKKILQVSGLVIFFLLIVIYALFGSHNLISGVKIKNVNITDGTKIANAVQEITGNAKNAINLTLNGRAIPINQASDFKETIVLLPGYNIITIKAQDKFGETDEKNYKLIFQP
ncbi:hypothetical protein A3A03_02790 [Candidatus Nomurabacteria bacterium RIFCSPLOWO2_01_FULL_40_18]|uniref:Uncharacterized protein n=1 Tax=Candidatus Nomurabacteria bacterium RIFCSPLOWO2_01_FULL_40_18 TaxID=1801773 RepID=A0A1F6XK85_9BACT|nr:MAG: hypothetical protein A3A03_02790 [Candidatus Nomurabacteria bacterium RIFCSPLOWO2_01_FULL_40_18]